MASTRMTSTRQGVTTRRRLVAAAAAALAVGGFALSACGGEDAAKATTTTEAASGGSGGSQQQSGGSAVLNEITQRGKPKLGPTPEVTELKITDDVVGTGAEVKPGDTVTAHYVGVSASNGQEFDSSWSRGAPTQFPLNGVIEGWQKGLVGMKEGGRRTLVIPASMAYGQTPPPGSGIAPGATLVFTVDLVSVD